MESRISIAIDFDNSNRPVIKIIQKKSEDVRDSLLSNFINFLDHTSRSRWMRLEYVHEQDGNVTWQIVPIATTELPEEVKLMQAVLTEIQPVN
jgi:hypothetical protein